MRVVLHNSRFRPFHLARSEALRSLACDDMGKFDVTGMSVASMQDSNPWIEEVVDNETVYLFPGQNADSLSRHHVRSRTLEALSEIDPEAVIITGYTNTDSHACLEWCRTRRRVAVLASDSRRIDARRAWHREATKSLLVKQYDAAIVAGVDSKTYIESLGMAPDRIFDPWNVVDNDFFSNTPAPGSAPQPTDVTGVPVSGYFLASSRLIPLKNLSTLITAYLRYLDRRKATGRPARHLVILGDGPERAALERRVAEAGVTSIALCGHVAYRALPPFLRNAAVFIHPALSETWGLAVNEAMAASLPVLVSTGTGCSRELVREGINGYLFDPHDAERLADLMEMTHQWNLQELGGGSRAIIERFSPHAFALAAAQAMRAGRATADRPLSRSARYVMAALRSLSRSASSFTVVER